MPDTNPTTTNPSDATPPSMDAALRELVGAAHTASILLEHAAAMEDGRSLTLGLAMGWLSGKLANSAETLEAIYDEREPSWFCHDDANEIGEALRKASARAAARAALRSVES